MRNALLFTLVFCLSSQAETVTSKGEHNHGYGGCLGEITVSETTLTYKGLTGPLAAMHSFSAPMRNIVTYKFIDNRGGSDTGRARVTMLELYDWSAADGTKGNSGLTLIFEDPKAFTSARRLMDAAHKQK